MKILVILCTAIWLSVIGFGTSYLSSYETTPGIDDLAHPQNIPKESFIKSDKELPTLVFFAHPFCPCTRASLNELNRLMTEINGHVKTYVVFIKPLNSSADWGNTDLILSAKKIPGVQVLIDENEYEAQLFSAQTSGLTLLYDIAGKLQFSGGITATRGQEGDNTGRRVISDIILRDSAVQTETMIFGCPLFNKENCRHKSESR